MKTLQPLQGKHQLKEKEYKEHMLDEVCYWCRRRLKRIAPYTYTCNCKDWPKDLVLGHL